MRTFRALAFLVLALPLLLAGCAGGQQQAPTVDSAAISAVIDSLGQAMNAAFAAKDTNAIMAFYTDDAHVLPANAARADGQEAIRKSWAGVLAMPGFALTVTSGQKTVSQAGDLVVELGTYDFKVTGPKQKPMHDVGKFVTVWKQVNGQWKMLVDTWNSDTPMPAPGK